jgi:hypothetical protein
LDACLTTAYNKLPFMFFSSGLTVKSQSFLNT